MKEDREVVTVPVAASAVGMVSPALGASRSSKAPDSACSVGNSQSQRSGSSKSRISNSTGSGSSGYGGHPSTLSSGNDTFPQPRSKDKDHRKKKLKGDLATPDAPVPTSGSAVEATGATTVSFPHKKSDTASATQGVPSMASATHSSAHELAKQAASGLALAVAEADAKASGVSSVTPAGDARSGSMLGPSSPSAGIHRVAFSQSLSGISKSKGVAAAEAALVEGQKVSQTGDRCHQQAQLQQPASDKKDEFTVVVSMQDGAVIYTSPSITQALSFPRDMWVGKSFIDYVHSDDRLALIQHITSGVALPRRQPNNKGGSGESPAKEQAPSHDALFCRLRRYPSLREGFAVAERGLVYRPFSLRLSFYELPASGNAPAALPPGVLLTITATAICSAYTSPDEKAPGVCKFATRHQADGQLTHVDSEAVPLLGYLPQELLNRSIFDIYHPADMHNLQHVYQQLVSRACEPPLRGQPYRLRAHNGCYVHVLTDWSSFVNPWTKRLEFVIGQHCVLQGPSCPDVFAESQDEEMFAEELLQDSKVVQQEICHLLQEEVRRGEPGADRRDVSRRCKDLASFMETLIGEIGKPELRIDPTAAAISQKGPSFSERSSVTLGEISPHHDYYDSKSSSETPPSYNQLNYNDNIQRFFESKPKTIPSDDSGEQLMALDPTNRSTDEEIKLAATTNDCRAARNCLSPVNDTGSGSNSGSGSGSTGVSANNGSVDAADADGDYKPPQLTEALLSRHNEDMEKRMVQRHREQRNKSAEGKCKKQHHCQQQPDKSQVENTAALGVSAQMAGMVGAMAHGTKRSGSHSWDGEPLKASKHSHAPSPPAAPPPPVPPRDEALPPAAAPGPPVAQAPLPAPAAIKEAELSLWPPFSVAVTPLHPPQPCASQGNFCASGCWRGGHPYTAPQILPLYYLPTPTSAAPTSNSSSKPYQQMPGVTNSSAAFLQQQGGTLPYVAAGVLYQAAPLLYPLAPPPPPPPSHLLALHQPLLSHEQHRHPSSYQLAAAARSGLSASRCQRSSSSQLQSHQHQHHHQQQQQQQQQQQHDHQHQLPPPLPRPASCATSVKVEPGSSVASVTASVLNRGASDGSQKCCRTSGEEETEAEDSGSGSGLRGQSSSSYTYSFLRSDGDSCRDGNGADTSADATAMGVEDMFWERMDNGSSDGATKRRPVLKDPPWLENVEVTPDLMYRYQVSERELDAVLQDDLQKLRAISQPMLVNEQLGQLYLDMARLGPTGKELHLEEGDLTSSSSGSGNDSAGADRSPHKTRRKRRSLEYSKLVMIFEENAPMPSPVSQPA